MAQNDPEIFRSILATFNLCASKLQNLPARKSFESCVKIMEQIAKPDDKKTDSEDKKDGDKDPSQK
jgi:hypothetical protein